MISVNF